MQLSSPTLTPEAFVARWQNASLSERASYQQHFADVCRLVGAPTPIEHDTTGEDYTYEYGLKKTDGRQGYADVFYRGHFAIEYKQKGKYADLSQAYRQLQQYRENLNNPPLLIGCDIEHWEIHTNFTNAPTVVIRFNHADLLKTDRRNLLRRMFTDPGSFHPEKNKLEITEDVAATFKSVVDDTLEWQNDPERVARFMTKLVFCMFVEDIGLLPKRAYDGILTEIVKTTRVREDYRELFPRYVRELFEAMATGGNVQMLDIPYFNGSMFDAGQADIVPLGVKALNALDQASDRNWAHVEPSVFGTIFERTLDDKKRSQLGAHYTHPDDIRLIVEPVLMAPLRRAWEQTQAEAEPLHDAFMNAANRAQEMAAADALERRRAAMLERVRTITVLDPACGSGNFLYISLRLLLDLEKEIIMSPLWAGLPAETIRVHPAQLFGIEINEIAHALASVVVWIGYLQWRQDNGFFEITQPILTRMENNILHRDAILAYDASGQPREPDWPPADVIVGNPPFLGDKKMRGELGDKYVADLRRLYEGRIPGQADLVTYWFEKARAYIEQGKAKRAGLLATNSIRQGANRDVLKRIKDSGDIFWAWSDRPWLLDGAAVRVSMVGFDNGQEKERRLNNLNVGIINPDLTTHLDITDVKQLDENQGISFIGTQKGGAFDIDYDVAIKLLKAENASGLKNSDVVRPWVNGTEIVNRPHNRWIIYFDNLSEAEAAQYEAPFAYVVEHVKPQRLNNSDRASREYWWLHQRPRGEMKTAVAPLMRYIVTPRVSKHRVFIWQDKNVVPDSRVLAIARDDDYFFGVLHSKVHEVWSIRQASWHGVGNDPTYNAFSCFETFPFPFPPGSEDVNDARVQAISAAARALHEERAAWLAGFPRPQPLPAAQGGESVPTLDSTATALQPDATPPLHAMERGPGGEDKTRTLTNLYNALVAYRSGDTAKGIKPAAAAFAPRLAALHDALDAAVGAAYGWDAAVLADDEAILRHLLALNAARSQAARAALQATGKLDGK